MDDKRKHPRRIADEVLRIYDVNTGQRLGQVVNISSHGFMLIGDRPVESNAILQLRMVAAEPRLGTDKISFGAESLWCTEANETNRYWSGFQIIDISNQTVDLITGLTQEWRAQQ
ncbi:MAG: PilZ domain-containing protein [Pseudomonadota bacterium]|nr:PilZ domain-containing protein [Pseudomonadota bacterium]